MLPVIVSCLLASALAQEPAPAATPAPAAAPATDAAPVDPLLAALDLPNVAAKLREEGVPEEEVRTALRSAQERHVSAGETHDALDAAEGAVREHGTVDHFGGFIQEQLESGKRGQELAEAIRTEHEQHGHGPSGEHGEREGQEAGERGEGGERGEAGERGERPEAGERDEAGERGERGEAGEHGEKRPESSGHGEQGEKRPESSGHGEQGEHRPEQGEGSKPRPSGGEHERPEGSRPSSESHPSGH